MEYEHDIFVSYRRRGNIPTWVSSVLAPELKNRLDAYLPEEVRIAVDQHVVEVGDHWPTVLSEKYACSKVFVMVLSANYFRSGWCLSEWRNAHDRQAALREAGIECPPLVFPLRYNDLKDEDVDRLPTTLRDEVRGVQQGRVDLGGFTTLVNPSGDNERAMQFRDAIEELCERRLRHSIDRAPAVDPGWPRLPKEPYRGDDPRWRATL